MQRPMLSWLTAIALVFALPRPGQSAGIDQTAAQGLLPAGAQILEMAPVPAQANRSRQIVLWMDKPTRHPRDTGEDYTCPEFSRGSYYSGPARVSLIDSSKRTLLQSLKITAPDGSDSLDLPYLIQQGHYYEVPGVKPSVEGAPHILSFVDHTGQGQAADFVLYDAESCTGPDTTLIGYRINSDKLVQYPVELKVQAGAASEPEKRLWVDSLYMNTAKQKGHAVYELDYRGRGGTLDRYDVQFDKAGVRFTGSQNRQADE